MPPRIIRAPATPMSNAQNTPKAIDTFFQTLSSTRLLLSDPSIVGDGPGKDTACGPSEEIGAPSALAWEGRRGVDWIERDAGAWAAVPQPRGSGRLPR